MGWHGSLHQGYKAKKNPKKQKTLVGIYYHKHYYNPKTQ